jgi:hemin uptake protein HemP
MTYLDRSLTPPSPRRWVAEMAELPAPPRAVTSEALLQGARRLTIAHGGEVYTLHLTRQNKLLLTK